MGGGMAVMVVDALRKKGLELPPLTSSTMETLNSILSQRWSHGNPVDPAGDFPSYHLLWAMLEDKNLDSIVIIGGVGMASSFAGWAGIPPSMKYDANRLRKTMEESELGSLEKTIELMRRQKKPVIFTTMVWGAKRRGKIFRKLKQSYLEPYPTPEKSATVLAHLVRYSEYLGVAKWKYERNRMAKQFRVVARVLSQKGTCAAGHKMGDEFALGDCTPAGMCSWAFYTIFPFATALQFGGSFPWEDSPGKAVVACPDSLNPVVFELRRTGRRMNPKST